MRRAIRLVAIAPLLAGLGWTSAVAIELGTAGEVAFTVGNRIAALRASDASTPDTWETAHAQLLAAQPRASADPAIHDILGVIDMRRGTPEYLDEAAVHFARALELRPTSAYTWANLAAVRYRQGRTGGEFQTAIVRAAWLGPQEPEVQRQMAHYGLAVWDELEPNARRAVDAMVAAGLKRKPLEMLQIAERRGRLAVACAHLGGLPRPTDPKWFQLCPSMEAI